MVTPAFVLQYRDAYVTIMIVKLMFFWTRTGTRSRAITRRPKTQEMDENSLASRVLQNLDEIASNVRRVSETRLGKPMEEFTERDFALMRRVPEYRRLMAAYEREERSLRMLQAEQARGWAQTTSWPPRSH